MAKRLQLRGGTTTEHSTFTGALREVTVDTDKDTLVVHDGATAGGIPLATATNLTALSATNLTSGTIPDARFPSALPAIDGSALTGIDTNATHSGEVTGATALTIADNIVDEANLKVSNAPTNGYFLSAQSGNTGGMTWVEVPAADFSAVGEHLLPSTDDTYDLGSASKQWSNIYTGDLHLSNESKSEGNIVDGTNGNWTIQEGAEDLFILNNKSGKKYKFKLEEI